MLLTVAFHIAQGTFSYGVLGFTGADAARMDWIVGVLWFAIAAAVIVFDREAWRAAPRSARAQHRR